MTATTRMVPIVVVVAERTVAELADIAEHADTDWSLWAETMERNGWTKEMLTGGALIDGYLAECTEAPQ